MAAKPAPATVISGFFPILIWRLLLLCFVGLTYLRIFVNLCQVSGAKRWLE
jgi:hypothetical protein